MKNLFKGLLCAVAVMTSLAANAATYTYVGNWQVSDGPIWFGSPPDGPLAYTGLEAAAFLFGGSPADYAISTNGVDPTTVNHQAWYDVIGIGGNTFAEGYFNKYLGLYYGPTDGYIGGDSASAYVQDNTSGLTNYAFRVNAVPEPETYAMLLAGLGVMGAVARRRKAVQK